ncbi:MAG TPA: NAD(P)/FAD-dependent oxidoreductase [Candidatus Elarobacter sp.]|jgi:pyruvate/2-oxoglutarate dehydrogenase complex dihydrolipoamide dehydrogenase (E3) component
MGSEERHELCVIGAGTAGYAAAEAARDAGRDVVMIAGNDELGGTCILRGCMPAKTVLAAAQYEGEVERARSVGVETGQVHVDLPAIIRRKRALVDYFAADRRHELSAYALVRGDARFVAGDTIVAAGKRIRAERFVIATGAAIVPPRGIELDGVPLVTSNDVLEMTHAPRRIAIAGGGPIGCAFAQFFARLGTQVTLFQDAPELLRNEDPDVGTAIRAVLQNEGVTVVCDADLRSAVRARADVVLLAANRRPNVAGLDLAAAGIDGDTARGILVDATLRSVSNPRVFAAGDVIGRRQLVHTAAYGGRLAAANAFADPPIAAEWERWETHAVYTQPQIAVVGLDERACRARGIEVDVATVPAAEVGKALVAGEAEGYVKMLARRDDGRVVGVTLVTDDAIDLAGEAIALLDRGVTAREITAMPHLHPTMSELLASAAERLLTQERKPARTI